MWFLGDDISELKIKFPDTEFHILEKVASTNDLLKSLAKDAPSPTVAIAKRQTQGRGRKGRSFLSEEGGLYLSLLVPRCGIPTDDVGKITASAAALLSLALDSLGARGAAIKWMNDVFIGNKKIAGILTEGAFDERGGFKYVIIGVGVNLYLQNFGELSDIASDIESECGVKVDIRRLTEKLISGLRSVLSGNYLLDEYRKRLFSLGEITVTEGGASYPALALGIDDEARLIIKDEGGNIRHLISAEVSIKLKD